MAKSKELPGLERPTIKEIETAAEDYVSVRDKRMALTEKEVAAKTNLIQIVQQHEGELGQDGDGNPCYRYDDMVVILKSGKANVKVRHATDESEEDDDE